MSETGTSVTDKIRENIRKFREEASLTQRALGEKIGKSESAIQGYESGKTDIPLSALAELTAALKVSIPDLVNGKQKKELKAENRNVMELRIYTQEERLNVAAILIKNGYKVSQGKRNRTKTGKALDYFLAIEESADPVDTSR